MLPGGFRFCIACSCFVYIVYIAVFVCIVCFVGSLISPCCCGFAIFGFVLCRLNRLFRLLLFTAIIGFVVVVFVVFRARFVFLLVFWFAISLFSTDTPFTSSSTFIVIVIFLAFFICSSSWRWIWCEQIGHRKKDCLDFAAAGNFVFLIPSSQNGWARQWE
jgi:hypothetical protein